MGEEFEPTVEDDRYVLQEEFNQCTIEDDYSNVTDWFNCLDEINMKLSNIDGDKYIKSEDDIKLQIRINLPEEVYSEVITSLKD